GSEKGLPRGERTARGQRARRDHAALLQRRSEVHRQGRRSPVGEIAGPAVGSEAPARGSGSEVVLQQRLPAGRVRDACLQVLNRCHDRAGHRAVGEDRKLGYTYDDLRVGMAFRSPGRTITDADLVAFAGLTGDYSELHTSDVYAKSSQFGRRVAHGMLGLAYAHGLMWARTG